MKPALPPPGYAAAALAAAVLSLLGMASSPAAPAWWSDPATSIAGNTPVNDWAAANLGQLKHVATQAKAHLDFTLASIGGAGPEIDAMCQFTQQDNYAPAAVGQLKNVAKVFYDRLAQAQWNWQTGYPGTTSTTYPWSGTTHAENAAPINIGQLKHVFSFDLSSWATFDQDSDSMPDGWEVYYGLNPGTDDGLLDADDDGITNVDEYNNQTSPVEQNVDGITLFSRTVTAIYSQDSNSPWYPPDAPVGGLTTQYFLTLARSSYVAGPIGTKIPWYEAIQPPSTHQGLPPYSQLDTLINPQWFHPRDTFHMQELSWPPVDPVASASAGARPSDYEGSAVLTSRMLWLRAPARPYPWKMAAVLKKEGFREQLYPSSFQTISIGPEYSIVEFSFSASSVWSEGVPVISKIETPSPRSLLNHSGSSSTPGSEHSNWYLLPIDIREVVSDQISGNECNKLPTPYFRNSEGTGGPNNPMLMAARTGKAVHLVVRMDVPAAVSSKIFVGAREVGSTVILGSTVSIASPGNTMLSFNANSGHKIYEVVAGYDSNLNGVLENSEANIVFEKTPKIDSSGSVATANLSQLDKIIIVEQDQFINSKNFLFSGGNLPFTDYAGDLLEAFAEGSSTIEDAATTFGITVQSTNPSLTHQVGAKWNASCQATTHRFDFNDGSEASNDFESSNALKIIIDSVINDNLDALIAYGTAKPGWPVLSLPAFSKPNRFSISEEGDIGVNELNLAFGSVTITGILDVSFRVLSSTSIEVGTVKVNGSFTDLYDFDYWSGSNACSAAIVQAGNASLSTVANPSGKIFYTRLNYNTGWFSLNKNFFK